VKRRKKIIFVLLFLISLIGILSGIFFAYRSRRCQEKKIYELFVTAEDLKRKGKFEEAIVVYKLLVETYPDSKFSPQSLYEIGKISEFYLKDFEKSKKIYLEIRKKYKESEFSKFAENKLKKRSEFYEKVIREYPKGNYSPFEILNIYKNNLKDAIIELNFLIEGYEKWDKSENFIFALAKIYKIEKNYIDSLKIFKKLISEFPESSLKDFAYLEISDIYFKTGDTEKANFYLENLIPNKNFQNIINYGKGEILFKEKNYGRAKEFYKKIEEEFAIIPQNYFSGKEPMLKIAEIEEKMGEFEKCLTTYQNFLEKYKKLNFARKEKINYVYLKIGNIYFILNDFEKAIEIYQKIIKTSPQDKKIFSEALYRIGIIKEIKGEEVSSSYYENILKKYDSDIIIPCYYHYVKKFQEEFSESTPPPTLREIESIEENIAKTYGDKIIKKVKEKFYSEDNLLYHYILGDIYYYQGNYKKAQEKFKSLVKFTKEIKVASSVVDTLSLRYFECEKYLRKIFLREKVKLLEDKNKELEDIKNYLELSELYRELNWYPESIECYKKIISLDGDFWQSLYEENLKKLKEELRIISNNLYSQIEFILNTEYIENKNAVLKELKIDSEKYCLKLLEFLPSIYAGIIKKIEIQEDELKEVIGEDIKIIDYQKNFKFLFPKDKEDLEKQKNLFKGTIQMFKILKEIGKIKDGRELKKDYSIFLRNFAEEYLK
jgi:tetratricopeptide (TPR) repeat protein